MLRSERCKGVAYIAVAMKSYVDAETERTNGTALTVDVNLDVPVAEMANAGLGAPLVPSVINPGARMERKFESNWIQKNVAQGTEKQPLLNGAMAYLKVKMQVMMILTKQKMVEMSKTMSHGAMKLTLK